jgi:hypothetical protein
MDDEQCESAINETISRYPNTPEYRYTQTHGRIRNCIERVNGTLKVSFRCLRKEMHYDPSFAAKIIYA